MPNYVTNRLKIVGEEKDVQEVLDFLGDEYEDDGVKKRVYINFNKIIALPEELAKTPCAWGMDKEYGEQYKANREKYGYSSWYDWCLDNWGTKWNAMDTELVDNDTIFFDTAWAGVPDLMIQVAKKFPNVTLYYDFADEDMGHNTGKCVFKGTEINEHYPQAKSNEAYELAFELGVGNPDHYELVDGKYRYKENFIEL